MSMKHFESARDVEIKRLKAELAKYDTPSDETTGLRIKIVELEKEIAALKTRLAPIEAVYERFKHLDKLLSARELYQGVSPQFRVAHDLWIAIKEAEHGRERSL